MHSLSESSPDESALSTRKVAHARKCSVIRCPRPSRSHQRAWCRFGSCSVLVLPDRVRAISMGARRRESRTHVHRSARAVLALVAIVVGGLTFMFGEMGAKRQLAGIVFGGGLALFAAQFLVWLF